MTQEEKAKAYDEAIEKLRSLHDNYETVSTLIDIKEELEHIFPELKESEDERIRKDIISHFAKGIEGSSFDEVREKYKIWIAWLEKQGEHANFRNKIQIGDKVTRNEDGVLVNLSQLQRVAKPADVRTIGYWNVEDTGQNSAWSEEDRQTLRLIIDDLSEELNDEPDEADKEILCRKISFLNSLKPHPIHVWSREDNRTRLEITNYLECQKREEPTRTDILNKWIAWIANLDPQGKKGSQWKPSELQLECLDDAIKHYQSKGYRPVILMELLEELKKLKG